MCNVHITQHVSGFVCNIIFLIFFYDGLSIQRIDSHFDALYFYPIDETFDLEK